MRYRWIYGAAAIVAMLILPAVSQAQADSTCSAADSTGGNHPTCSVTKNATATIPNMLRLAVSHPDVRLLQNGGSTADDTLPFFKTWSIDSTAASGTDLSGSGNQLYASTDSNVVIAQGNRGYVVDVKAQDADFAFQVATGTCRKGATPVAGHCDGTSGNDAKPIGDLYFQPEHGAAAGTWIQASTTGTTLFSTAVGARFVSGIKLASAWFYASDIAGDYTATLVYTITGQ